MNIQNLIEALKEHVEHLDGEKIEKIDFDQMQEDLRTSVEALSSLQRKEELGDKLLCDFKSEIKRMSLAVSRSQGDMTTSGMVERLLSSENLSFEELILLREKVREDFNRSFPAKPQAKIVDKLGFGGSKTREFKAGVRE
jgi:magnesium-transporting ATPase (P-type)